MKNLFGEEIEETKEVDDIESFGKSSSEPKNKSNFYIDLLFKDQRKFSDLPTYEKGKNFFIMQRFFSIKYPEIANALNISKINPGWAVQVWANTLGRIYNKTPYWIFSTLKSVKYKKENKNELYSDELVEMYCKNHMMSRRDFDSMAEYCKETVEEELSEYKTMLEHKVSKTKIKK